MVRVSGLDVSEMQAFGTREWIFNNMVVLSRASWVQDDFERDCDDHALYWNEHRTVSAKQISRVVMISVGVSQVELSRPAFG